MIWPADLPPSRVIPQAAQSILVEIKSGSTVVSSATLAKPTTTADFTELPVGALTVEVTAYPTTDATGTPLAYATVPATIVADGTATVNVTLASTIDHLEITPTTLTIGVSASQQVTVTAKDVNGNVVLVDPSAISFVSSNPGVASVDSSGNVTAGSSVGSTTITVTEGDSGKTISLPVSVVPNVSVSPTSKTLTLNGTQLFTATVVGTGNTAVTWSVQEGTGGSVTAGGLYTAPNHKGVYHVIATSVADPTRKATATVTVQSGGATVVIH